jgi:hypothetical protein
MVYVFDDVWCFFFADIAALLCRDVLSVLLWRLPGG